MHLSSRLTPTALIVGALVLPASAEALTVSSTREDNFNEGFHDIRETVRVAPEPGEASALAVTVRPDAITVTEEAANVTAGSGCQQVDARTVRCAWNPPSDDTFYQRLALVDLGEGDDRVRTEGADTNLPFEVQGGPGADQLDATAAMLDVVLFGGDGDDVLTGGAASDRLHGELGTDTLSGGAGDDVVDGGAGPDKLEGGEGADSLNYSQSPTPVVVDLAQPSGGPGGEPDAIAGFESVFGGEGDDTLSGTSGPNFLLGGEGDDTLDGRAGDDVLEGERVSAGDGDDSVRGGVEVDCGAGRDRSEPVGLLLPPSCELVTVESAVAMTPLPLVGRRALRFRLSTETERGRRVRVTVRKAGRILARGKARVPRSGTTSVRVKLTRAGRRAIRSGRGGSIRVTYRSDGSPEGRALTTFRSSLPVRQEAFDAAAPAA